MEFIWHIQKRKKNRKQMMTLHVKINKQFKKYNYENLRFFKSKTIN